MRTKITYKSLIKKLIKIGFVEKRSLGSHLILVNVKFNSTLVVPMTRPTEIVAEYFLKTIRKNLVEKGILSDEQFYALMTGQD